MNTKKRRMEYDQQARKILEGLSLEEKIHLMSANYKYEDLLDMINGEDPKMHYNVEPYCAGGISEKGIPELKFVDGPRGVVCGNEESTCFPVSMLRGATFDEDLEERVGKAIGKEISAFGGNYFGGVCINLPYNPGWGRSQETYGEESFHIGRMGSALTRGVQSEGVMACIKHYAFNQMEISRFDVSVTCDKRTEREVFLAHFKDCIDAGAASVMSSYNRYNSVYCGHSKYLLTEVLKDEWDFDGIVTSDFVWGVRDTVEAANNGQDVEMVLTQYFGDKLVKAVEDGFVGEEKINEAGLRIIRTLLATQDNKKNYDKSVVGCEEHIQLALEAARKGITLVKNNNNLLPLKKGEDILVLGKLADKPNIGDYGSSRVYPAYVKTILESVKDAGSVTYNTGENILEAVELAKKHNKVIFVVGYNHDDEGEYISKKQNENYMGSKGGDRISLSLHEDEIELLQKIGTVNCNTVAVLIGGNTILMHEWIDNINSVVMAYYPGMEGGTAVKEILFGEVNPSGKLPFVVPYCAKDLPTVDWETNFQYYEYYHGYARLDKNKVKPMYHYGHGLSYTSFDISHINVKKDGARLVATCKVKNTGNCRGTEVVQMYIGFENSLIDRPEKLLRGFTRVELEPGEEKIVEVYTDVEKLKYYNPISRKFELENIKYNVYIGNSSEKSKFIENFIVL